ncbi:hypothetical protein MPSEU_000059400 [Mayamaea pseudoterrestris]|nr:hypothetical protein MPSEU_000059400 [Mayamaea pseudoterrestris]
MSERKSSLERSCEHGLINLHAGIADSTSTKSNECTDRPCVTNLCATESRSKRLRIFIPRPFTGAVTQQSMICKKRDYVEVEAVLAAPVQSKRILIRMPRSPGDRPVNVQERVYTASLCLNRLLREPGLARQVQEYYHWYIMIDVVERIKMLIQTLSRWTSFQSDVVHTRPFCDELLGYVKLYKYNVPVIVTTMNVLAVQFGTSITGRRRTLHPIAPAVTIQLFRLFLEATRENPHETVPYLVAFLYTCLTPYAGYRYSSNDWDTYLLTLFEQSDCVDFVLQFMHLTDVPTMKSSLFAAPPYFKLAEKHDNRLEGCIFTATYDVVAHLLQHVKYYGSHHTMRHELIDRLTVSLRSLAARVFPASEFELDAESDLETDSFSGSVPESIADSASQLPGSNPSTDVDWMFGSDLDSKSDSESMSGSDPDSNLDSWVGMELDLESDSDTLSWSGYPGTRFDAVAGVDMESDTNSDSRSGSDPISDFESLFGWEVESDLD